MGFIPFEAVLNHLHISSIPEFPWEGWGNSPAQRVASGHLTRDYNLSQGARLTLFCIFYFCKTNLLFSLDKSYSPNPTNRLPDTPIP